MSRIPSGMAEKQLRWEWVNAGLYRYLLEQSPNQLIRQLMERLATVQEQQWPYLTRLAKPAGAQLRIAAPQSFAAGISELYEREYQLLQEYLSYGAYFMPEPLQTRAGLDRLIALQQEQVHLLLDLRDTLPSLTAMGEHGTDGGHAHGGAAGAAAGYWLEPGYRLERVAGGLTYPTAVTFDHLGRIYVLEAGFAYGTEPRTGRLLRLDQGGQLTEVAGGFLGPATGVTFHDGAFYVAEGGRGGTAPGCGQITRVSLNGDRTVVVSGLPSCGDHFTGSVVVGSDSKLYFSVGTATNSGVVGLDNLPWLEKHPQFHDTPARPFIRTDARFVTPNPLTPSGEDVAITGAFLPFGTALPARSEALPRRLANGVIYRCNPDGTGLELVADGFRNPFGLRFSPFDRRLYASDNGADNRGSRPIEHDWDTFWVVTPGGWHGWPDFYSGLPATLSHFQAPGKRAPGFVIANHPPLASEPLVRFEHHTSSNKFDFATNPSFGHTGEVFIAQTGSIGWGHHEHILGRKVVRFNPGTGQIRDFLASRDEEHAHEGLKRPVEAQFSPDGSALFVVDFGVMGTVSEGLNPRPGTGALWRVVRT